MRVQTQISPMHASSNNRGRGRVTLGAILVLHALLNLSVGNSIAFAQSLSEPLSPESLPPSITVAPGGSGIIDFKNAKPIPLPQADLPTLTDDKRKSGETQYPVSSGVHVTPGNSGSGEQHPMRLAPDQSQ